MIYTLEQGVNRSREKLQRGLLATGAVIIGVAATALVIAGPKSENTDQNKRPLTISTIRGGSAENSTTTGNSPTSNQPPTSNDNQLQGTTLPGGPPSTISSNGPGFANSAPVRNPSTSTSSQAPSAPLPVGGSGGDAISPPSSSPPPESDCPCQLLAPVTNTVQGATGTVDGAVEL